MDYPIFDEAYRKDFETHFIRHFYMKHIGYEVASLFKMELETWLIINMPYYNRMFESDLIKFDPLVNTSLTVKNDKQVDNTRDFESENNATVNRNVDEESTTDNTTVTDGTDDNFNREINADTPNNRLMLTALDGEGMLNYASSINENTTNNANHGTLDQNGKVIGNTAMNQTDLNNTTNNTTSQMLEDSTYTKIGKIGVGSYSKMISEYRSTFARVEKQIFKEMTNLFLQIYL